MKIQIKTVIKEKKSPKDNPRLIKIKKIRKDAVETTVYIDPEKQKIWTRDKDVVLDFKDSKFLKYVYTLWKRDNPNKDVPPNKLFEEIGEDLADKILKLKYREKAIEKLNKDLNTYAEKLKKEGKTEEEIKKEVDKKHKEFFINEWKDMINERKEKLLELPDKEKGKKSTVRSKIIDSLKGSQTFKKLVKEAEKYGIDEKEISEIVNKEYERIINYDMKQIEDGLDTLYEKGLPEPKGQKKLISSSNTGQGTGYTLRYDNKEYPYMHELTSLLKDFFDEKIVARTAEKLVNNMKLMSEKLRREGTKGKKEVYDNTLLKTKIVEDKIPALSTQLTKLKKGDKIYFTTPPKSFNKIGLTDLTDVLLEQVRKAAIRKFIKEDGYNIEIKIINSSEWSPKGKVWEAKKFSKGARTGNISLILDHLRTMDKEFKAIDMSKFDGVNPERDLVIVLDDNKTSGATTSGIVDFIREKINIDYGHIYSITLAKNDYKTHIKDRIIDAIKSRINTEKRKRQREVLG